MMAAQRVTATSQDTQDDLEVVFDDQELAEIKTKSVSGAISFFLRTALLQGIGLASALVLSAFFSPEDFGVFGFVTQIIGILVFFSDIGLAATLIQKKDEPTLTEYKTAFTVQQLLAWLIVGLSLVLLLTGVVQDKTGQAGVWVLLSLAISFPLASFKTIPSIMLERRLLFSKLVLPQIVEQLLFHSILIALAWRGMGVVAYAYAILIRSVAGAVVMWYLQPWAFGLALDRSALRSLVGYGAKFQLNDFLARIKDQLFFTVLGLMLPLREFGYVQWAKNWSMFPYNLTVQNIMAITFPTFSRLQHHPAALKRAIEKSIFFITLAIFPLLVGMSVFILPVTAVVAKYEKWQPAVMIFVFFTLSIAWSAISTPLTNTLNAIGQINTTLKLMVMWTVLTWVITPLATWYWGFNGVGVATFLISFTSVLPIYYVKKIVPIEVEDQVWRQLLAAVMMGLVGWWGQEVWSQSAAWLVSGMLITSATYGLILLVVGWRKLKLEVLSLRKK